MIGVETSETTPGGEPPAPESAQESAIVLKEAYDLRSRIEKGEGAVSPEEYHSIFESALGRIIEDHSRGQTTQAELVGELSKLSRLQNEIGVMVFERLKSSRIDQLTGLPRADFFNIQIQEMLSKQAEYVRDEKTEFLTMAILIDVNELKPINDRIGHGAGDVALREVAKVIMRKLREGDPVQYHGSAVAGRAGGDEFVAVIDRVFNKAEDSATISHFVDEIIARFRHNFSRIDFEYEGETYSVSAAVGFAYTTDFANKGIERLIREADQDMYFQKPKRR